MTKNYAAAVRRVLERERNRGASFPAAWTTAMRQCPAPGDWTSPDPGPLKFMRRIFELAYVGGGPVVGLSDDMVPCAKDPSPNQPATDDGKCKSPDCGQPCAGEKWCQHHGDLFARVRDEIAAKPVSGHRIMDFDYDATAA